MVIVIQSTLNKAKKKVSTDGVDVPKHRPECNVQFSKTLGEEKRKEEDPEFGRKER
jgi:hypothetical protein